MCRNIGTERKRRREANIFRKLVELAEHRKSGSRSLFGRAHRVAALVEVEWAHTLVHVVVLGEFHAIRSVHMICRKTAIIATTLTQILPLPKKMVSRMQLACTNTELTQQCFVQNSNGTSSPEVAA